MRQNKTGKDKIDDVLSIPRGFYKVPNIESISNPPSYPYELPSKGMIHSNKIERLYNVITVDQSPKEKYGEIQRIFDGMAYRIVDLEEDEIADYLRHFVYLNRDELTWDIADKILYRLNEIGYYPRWELPGNTIDRDFRPVLRTIVTLDLSEKETRLLEKLLTEDINMLDPNLVEKTSFTELQEKRNFSNWNVKQLSTLYETVNLFCYSLSLLRISDYGPLISKLEKTFEDLIKDKNLEPAKSKALSFIYISGQLNKSIEDITRAKQLLEETYDNLHQDQKKDDYKWLFGSFFSRVAARLYEFEDDLIVRRRIINDFLNNYLKPDQVNFSTWTSHLLNTRPHPWLFSYYIQGYANMLFTLREHAKDLINEEAKLEILRIHDQIASFLLNLIIKYLLGDKHKSLDLIPDLITNLQLPPSHVRDLRRIMHLVINHAIIRRSSIDGFEEEGLEELSMYIMSSFYPEQYRYLFQLNQMMEFGDLDYQSVVNQIVEEFSKEKSLILCSTFENEIIRPFAILYNFIEEENRSLAELEAYFMKVILWNLSEWFWFLNAQPQLAEESNMILSSFITILFAKLAIYYIQNNQPRKSHLTTLNEYFFSLIASQLGVYNNEEEKIRKFGSVFEKIQEVYNFSFDFDPQIYNLRNISGLSLDTGETSSIAGETDIVEIMSDETILDYMDLRDNLANFLEIFKEEGLDQGIDKIGSLILESLVFEFPTDQSIDIFGKIGKNCSQRLISMAPFPLIRNINIYAVAIKLFPISINLPKFNIEMDL